MGKRGNGEGSTAAVARVVRSTSRVGLKRSFRSHAAHGDGRCLGANSGLFR